MCKRKRLHIRQWGVVMRFINISLRICCVCLLTASSTIAFAQQKATKTKSGLSTVAEYSRKHRKFVVAEVDDETYKQLLAPVRDDAQEVSQNMVQKLLNKDSEQQSARIVVFKQKVNPYTPVFQMQAAFKNDKEKIKSINEFLSSLSTEQWKGLEESGYKCRAGMLTAEQKQLLSIFVAPPQTANATYELDFVTWMGFVGADGTSSIRRVGGTVTP